NSVGARRPTKLRLQKSPWSSSSTAASGLLLRLDLTKPVMLVFGMGLYELFISNLSPSKMSPGETMADRSNLFGMFTLE
ncbi:hypothetical protein LINPERHAP2_LOCUS21089, partial [Linum perenne]